MTEVHLILEYLEADGSWNQHDFICDSQYQAELKLAELCELPEYLKAYILSPG